MRKFTIKRYKGKYNNGFYALKKNGKTIAMIQDRDVGEIIFHAVDDRVKFNRRG